MHNKDGKAKVLKQQYEAILQICVGYITYMTVNSSLGITVSVLVSGFVA